MSDQGLRPLIGAFLSSRCGPPGSPMGRLSCLPVCVYLLVMEMRSQFFLRLLPDIFCCANARVPSSHTLSTRPGVLPANQLAISMSGC